MHVVYHNFFYLVRVEKYSKGAYMYYFPIATIVLIYRNARLTCTCISATEYIGTAQILPKQSFCRSTSHARSKCCR